VVNFEPLHFKGGEILILNKNLENIGSRNISSGFKMIKPGLEKLVAWNFCVLPSGSQLVQNASPTGQLPF